jgi:CBS domain-containing protein
VRDVMRNGVVLCDANASLRSVARTMRDHDVTSAFAVDLDSEVIGLVDQRDLLKGWTDPDTTTAGRVMNPDPLIVDPEEPVDQVAQRMLQAGVTSVLVAPPPPTEESGVWSAWKERGLPQGTLSVRDILNRLDELEAAVRVRPARSLATVRQAAPWVAAGVAVLTLLAVAALIFLYTHTTHPLTNRPGL